MNDLHTENPDSVLTFWFGEWPEDAVGTARGQAPLWWKKHPAMDAEIRRRFEPLVLAGERGELEDWCDTPEGRLARILLADQYPRNIYRDTANAFHFDSMARELCLQGLEEGDDRRLLPIQRVFFYMPLEHAEDLELQNRCLALFEELAGEAGEGEGTTFAGFLDFARRHQAIIERFGRFPHRNAILGRPSTGQELEFLQQSNSSF